MKNSRNRKAIPRLMLMKIRKDSLLKSFCLGVLLLEAALPDLALLIPRSPCPFVVCICLYGILILVPRNTLMLSHNLISTFYQPVLLSAELAVFVLLVLFVLLLAEVLPDDLYIRDTG